MQVTIRVRMSAHDAHYGGNLVDGAKMLELFGDVATELLIRRDGDEGLFCAYDMVEFKAPVYAGDFIEATGEIVSEGNTSRKMVFEARKVITARPDINDSAAEVLAEPIKRAEEVGLTTIVCADSEEEAAKIATLNPDIIVAEPAALIGTGVSVGPEYVEAATKCVKSVNPNILVLTAAGISNGNDVYNTIIAGADATGSSSGVAKAADRAAMVDEMIAAVRKAWDERHN